MSIVLGDYQRVNPFLSSGKCILSALGLTSRASRSVTKQSLSESGREPEPQRQLRCCHAGVNHVFGALASMATSERIRVSKECKPSADYGRTGAESPKPFRRSAFPWRGCAAWLGPVG